MYNASHDFLTLLLLKQIQVHVMEAYDSSRKNKFYKCTCTQFTQRIHVHTCKVNLTFSSLNSVYVTGVQACFSERICILFILFIVSCSKVTFKRTLVSSFTAHSNGGDKYIRN